MEFSRRQFFRYLAGTAVLLSAIPLMAKAPKEQVAYQDSPKNGQRCDTCIHYEPSGGGSGTCKLVKGEVAAKGWCQLYAKKT